MYFSLAKAQRRKGNLLESGGSFFAPWRLCEENCLELEEVLDDLSAFGVLLVKKLRMELDAVQPPPFLLHGLNLAGLVRRSRTESIGQFFHFVAVVMPHSDLSRETFEKALARILNREESSLALGAVVAFARLESPHESDLRAVSECNLLMTTADAENGLARLLYHGEHARERLRRVHLPWMTLTAENDVRWLKAANAFQRDVVKRLDEDFETGNKSAKNGAYFARTGSLGVDGVVDKVD